MAICHKIRGGLYSIFVSNELTSQMEGFAPMLVARSKRVKDVPDERSIWAKPKHHVNQDQPLAELEQQGS